MVEKGKNSFFFPFKAENNPSIPYFIAFGKWHKHIFSDVTDFLDLPEVTIC